MSRLYRKPFDDSYLGFYESWTDNKEANKSNTSTIGYVPLVKRINSLLEAGENLESMRAAYYGLDADEDDEEQFDSDIIDVSQYDSKLELLTDLKLAEKRITKRKKKRNATKGAGTVVDNSESPKGANEELSTTVEASASECATE